MIVPCMVNSWLYCSWDRNWSPGRASSVRINNAITPPTMKKANDVVRYMMPSILGSVVRNIRSRYEPLTDSRAGYGRVAIGWGATAVTVPPALASTVPAPRPQTRRSAVEDVRPRSAGRPRRAGSAGGGTYHNGRSSDPGHGHFGHRASP